MSRLRWPNSRHSLSDVPGTVQNHLSGAVRPVPWGVAEGAHRLSAIRAHASSTTWPQGPRGIHQRPGPDRRPTRGDRRPRGARSLGGGPATGARGQSAIATLVERQTRYVMLLAVGRDKTSRHVCTLIAKKIRTLPQHLAVSLTWDRGKEMAGHRQFSIATGVQVYFCDPHSPWQRGTNENTNGLLRQYFPRGTDLSGHSQRHLNQVAHMLNNRPRQTLGWMKPSEKLAELFR